MRLLFLVAIVSNRRRLPHRTLPAVLPSITLLKVLQLSFVAWLFKILANIDFIQIKQSALLAVNNWLPLPYTVQAVSIIAVKCFRNSTQKSFDIMFQRKNTPFFSLSVSFLLREFLLYEKVPQMQTVFSSPQRTVTNPKREIRAKEPHRSQRQQIPAFSCAQVPGYHAGTMHQEATYSV